VFVLGYDDAIAVARDATNRFDRQCGAALSFDQCRMIDVHHDLVVVRCAGHVMPGSIQIRHGHFDKCIRALLGPTLSGRSGVHRGRHFLWPVETSLERPIERLVDELAGFERQFNRNRYGAARGIPPQA
jgi:hypothetical protein